LRAKWECGLKAIFGAIMRRFSPAVADRLGVYVYRLIDPRTGITFYVGRGRGSRLFQHAFGRQAPTDEEDAEDLKLRVIREIRDDANLEVLHVIHRHGLDEPQAREVEAALIDAYSGLANRQGGYNPQRGVMHVEQVVALYEAQDAVFEHNVLLVNVGNTLAGMDLYDSTRYAWAATMDRANAVDYVLPVARGLIKGAFIAQQWLAATPGNFPGFPRVEGRRVGFVGVEAPPEIVACYRGKRVTWGPYAFRYGGPIEGAA
jgi:uncharacterized protein